MQLDAGGGPGSDRSQLPSARSASRHIWLKEPLGDKHGKEVACPSSSGSRLDQPLRRVLEHLLDPLDVHLAAVQTADRLDKQEL